MSLYDQYNIIIYHTLNVARNKRCHYNCSPQPLISQRNELIIAVLGLFSEVRYKIFLNHAAWWCINAGIQTLRPQRLYRTIVFVFWNIRCGVAFSQTVRNCCFNFVSRQLNFIKQESNWYKYWATCHWVFFYNLIKNTNVSYATSIGNVSTC